MPHAVLKILHQETTEMGPAYSSEGYLLAQSPVKTSKSTSDLHPYRSMRWPTPQRLKYPADTHPLFVYGR